MAIGSRQKVSTPKAVGIEADFITNGLGLTESVALNFAYCLLPTDNCLLVISFRHLLPWVFAPALSFFGCGLR